MTRISVTREIAAPVDVVFDAITNIERLPETNPDVVRVEFLGEQRSGVGTRFRETRAMGKKQMDTDLEIVELVPGEHARMVTDSHGTIWDTTFYTRPSAAGTELEIRMDARPHKLLTKILTPVMKGVFRKGMEKHSGNFATYCEGVAKG